MVNPTNVLISSNRLLRIMQSLKKIIAALFYWFVKFLYNKIYLTICSCFVFMRSATYMHDACRHSACDHMWLFHLERVITCEIFTCNHMWTFHMCPWNVWSHVNIPHLITRSKNTCGTSTYEIMWNFCKDWTAL